MIDHKERDHALLSASAADRWTACTPSARLGEQFPDTTSEAAAEGTLAHEIAELRLRKYFVEPISQTAFTRRLNKLKKKEFYQDEMLRHTEDYLNYIKEIALKFDQKPHVAVEKKVDFSAYAPEGFGTVDCLMIHSSTLYVIDFKYGRNKAVDANETVQLRLYALGAMQEYSFLYSIKDVVMVVFQPRNPIGTTECRMSAEELKEWGESITDRAQAAFDGEGELLPGAHCGFCPAKPICRAQAEQFDRVESNIDRDPKTLGDDEKAYYLQNADAVISWLKSLKEHSLSVLLQGGSIPGYKLVEGRKGRGYTDQDAAFQFLQEKGISEALLYDRVPLTLPKVEKAIGKKEYEELLVQGGYVKQLSGKPTLVPDSDKRSAIAVTPSAQEDFAT